jgi:very-short-patch-repair endonuclease
MKPQEITKVVNQLQYIQRGLKYIKTLEHCNENLIKVNNIIKGYTINNSIEKRVTNITESIFLIKERLLNKSNKVEKILENTIDNSFKSSKGEDRIQEYLIKNNIPFVREQEFDGLINNKTGYRLRFDFYLPELRACIEFDGQQHFQYSEKFDKGDPSQFENRVLRDSLKDKFCNQKGLILLRIKFNDYNNITNILKKFITKYTLKPMTSNWYKK